jgi:hypothetical protein
METKDSSPRSLEQGAAIPLDPVVASTKKDEAKARGLGKGNVRASDAHPLKEALKKTKMGHDDVVQLD